MKEFKGTKGKWRIDDESNEPIEIVLVEKGWSIGKTVVAYMGQEDEAGIADATLMAAAPDLLAVCQEILKADLILPKSLALKIEAAIDRALTI